MPTDASDSLSSVVRGRASTAAEATGGRAASVSCASRTWDKEALQRPPGVGVGQGLLAVADEVFEAGGGDGLQQRLGGGEVPVDGGDPEARPVCDIVEL